MLKFAKKNHEPPSHSHVTRRVKLFYSNFYWKILNWICINEPMRMRFWFVFSCQLIFSNFSLNIFLWKLFCSLWQNKLQFLLLSSFSCGQNRSGKEIFIHKNCSGSFSYFFACCIRIIIFFFSRAIKIKNKKVDR